MHPTNKHRLMAHNVANVDELDIKSSNGIGYKVIIVLLLGA